MEEIFWAGKSLGTNLRNRQNQKKGEAIKS